jgi:hypothetical protein
MVTLSLFIRCRQVDEEAMLPKKGTLAALKTHYLIGLYVNDERLKQKASER